MQPKKRYESRRERTFDRYESGIENGTRAERQLRKSHENRYRSGIENNAEVERKSKTRREIEAEKERERKRRREIKRQEAKKQKAEKRRRMLSRVSAFFILLFGFLDILLILFLLFFTQDVKVKGNEYTPSKVIIEAVKDDRYSVNNLYIMGKYLLGKGKSVETLSDIHVGITFPWVLEVEVKEKKVVACVDDGQTYAYIDKEGMIVNVGYLEIENIPVFTNVPEKEIKLYNVVNSVSKHSLAEVLKLEKLIKENGLSTKKIVCEGEKVYIYIDSMQINLGSDISSDQIAQIPAILEKFQGETGVLHLENYQRDSSTISFKKGEIEEK